MTQHPPVNDKDLKDTNLEVQCSLVCEISLVPSQSYYNIWTGLSLKLFNPVLRPYKWLLANKTGRGREMTQLEEIKIRSMWWKDEDDRSIPMMSSKASVRLWSRPRIETLKNIKQTKMFSAQVELKKHFILNAMAGDIYQYHDETRYFYFVKSFVLSEFVICSFPIHNAMKSYYWCHFQSITALRPRRCVTTPTQLVPLYFRPQGQCVYSIVNMQGSYWTHREGKGIYVLLLHRDFGLISWIPKEVQFSFKSLGKDSLGSKCCISKRSPTVIKLFLESKVSACYDTKDIHSLQ